MPNRRLHMGQKVPLLVQDRWPEEKGLHRSERALPLGGEKAESAKVCHLHILS